MNTYARMVELIASIQRDALPSLLRINDEDDLKLTHLGLLMVLERRGSMTIKELAPLIGRSESRTSRLVDQLVKRRFAQRDEDGADRRRKLVRLSANGIEHLRRVNATKVDAQREMVAYMTEHEQRQVLEMFEIFAKAARRYRDANEKTD